MKAIGNKLKRDSPTLPLRRQVAIILALLYYMIRPKAVRRNRRSEIGNSEVDRRYDDGYRHGET